MEGKTSPVFVQFELPRLRLSYQKGYNQCEIEMIRVYYQCLQCASLCFNFFLYNTVCVKYIW